MSVTIDSLDIQISSSAGRAAANIDQLADALGRLKSASSLTKVSNNLTKLSTALSTIQGSSAGIQGISSLAGAMQSLSTIGKPSGLNSALNAIKKIPEIMSKLDDGTITVFTGRMQDLALALRPLATEIDTIANGFSRLPSRISSVVTATNRMARANRDAEDSFEELGEEINTTSLNLATGLFNLQSVIGIVHQVRDALSGAIAEAIEWDGIQFRFGRAFGEDAEEALAYVEKLSDALLINQQYFMQHASMYGSLLSGFGMAQDQVTTISIGLTELSYDIWAAYNDRYKTLEDASEAVRSAITGEIEPIRNAGIALTEASMQEYLDNLGMAHIKMSNLSEAQKAQVRYATMVNAAMNQGIVGTYANEMQTAEGAMRTLTQQLKGLTQAFGSIFIPVLSAVIPWVTAFVSILYDAIAAVAAFFSLPFFKISWGGSNGASGLASGLSDIASGAGSAGKALGGAAGAAKELQDYTMGFDELNIIDPPSSGGGGGGGGGGSGGGVGSDLGLDLDTLWNDSILAKAGQQVDEIKAKILDWKNEIIAIASSLAALGLSHLLVQWGEAIGLGGKYLGVLKDIRKFAGGSLIVALEFTLAKAAFKDYLSEDGSFWDYIKGLLISAIGTGALYAMFGPTGLVIGVGVTVAAAVSAIFEDGGLNGETGLMGATALAGGAFVLAKAWKQVAPFVEALKGIRDGSAAASSAFTFMAPKLADLIGKFELAQATVMGFFGSIKNGIPFMSTLEFYFPTIASAIGKVGRAIQTVFGFFSGTVGLTVTAIVAAIASAAYFLYENWEKVNAAVRGFFETNIVPKLEEIKEHWENLKSAFSDAGKAISDAIPPEVKETFQKIGEWFVDAAEKVKNFVKEFDLLGKIGEIIEFVGGVIFAVVSGVIAGAFSMVVSVIENFVQVISGIAGVIGGMVEFVVALLQGDWKKAWESVKKIASSVGDIFDGLWGLVVGGVKEFVKGVIDWFTKLWDELVGHSIVPDTIKGIVDWFLKLPKEILSPVKKFVEDIINTFKGMWENIKSWWNSTVAPKLTVAYWKGVFDNVKKGISNKISDIKGEIESVWNKITSWFNSNVAPKLTLNYWKDKFNNIAEGLKSKWTEAKNWWDNNKPSLATVKAVIESIKDKLSEAWTTAKNWWDNNKPTLSKITLALDSITGALQDAWASAKAWWNNNVRLSIPSVSLKVSYKTSGLSALQSAVVKALKLQGWPSLSFAAAGGVFSQGSMIWAGEAGPEIVANARGGRTGVMNMEQMQSAVSAGVYSAVVAAMSQTQGGSQAVNVYLDGKQIYSSVKKTEAERGMTLMGNQLGYAY